MFSLWIDNKKAWIVTDVLTLNLVLLESVMSDTHITEIY